MKQTNFFYLIVTVGLLVLGFQNCSKAQFGSDAGLTQNASGSDLTVNDNDINGDGKSPDVFGDTTQGQPIDITLVRANCANKDIKTVTVDVDFSNPGVVCEFGKDNNLDKRNAYFQARRVQNHAINIPAGATICDADFYFEKQEFWFDDVFMLTIDQNILVSSYKFDEYFEKINGFYLYNWGNLQGQFWDEANKSEDYCAGAELGLAPLCSFPSQHDIEPIELDLDKQVIQGAMANSGFIDHSFHLVTTGDNDNSDCQHFDMKFQVIFSYVE